MVWDGLGWDGRLYYQMCNNSIHDITHQGYSWLYVKDVTNVLNNT